MSVDVSEEHVPSISACCLLHAGFSLTLKKVESCSSETSVDFHRLTGHYIPEDRTLHHRCENLESNILFFIRLDAKSVLMLKQDPWGTHRVMHKPTHKKMGDSRAEGSGAAL
jgi:hypothetical protein